MDDLFHHMLAVLHDPTYQEANAGALRMEWPRIPLPGWPDGDTGNDTGGAAQLNWRHPPSGAGNWPACWTRKRRFRASPPGALRPEMSAIGVPATADGTQHGQR